MNVSGFPTNFKLGPWSIELGNFLLKSQNVSLLHFDYQQIKLEFIIGSKPRTSQENP